MQSTNIFESKVIPSEFKINERVILIKTVNELTANLLIELVIAQVETQESLIGSQCLYHFLDPSSLLSIMRQIVRLEVQVPQSLILSQSQCEHTSRLHAQAVTLQLDLPQRAIGHEHARNVLPLLVLDSFPAQVDRFQGRIESDHFGQNERPSGAQLHPTQRVVMRCVILLCLLHKDKHSPAKSLTLFLLHRCFPRLVGSRPVPLLFLLLLRVFFLFSLPLIFHLLVS